MRFRNTEVWGFKHAIRGMRNPKNSWERIDSTFEPEVKLGENCVFIDFTYRLSYN